MPMALAYKCCKDSSQNLKIFVLPLYHFISGSFGMQWNAWNQLFWYSYGYVAASPFLQQPNAIDKFILANEGIVSTCF